MANNAFDSDGLGSLAQYARMRRLTIARYSLFGAGVVTVLFNLVMLQAAESTVQQEFKLRFEKARREKQDLNPVAMQELREKRLRSLVVIHAIAVGSGVVLLLFGFMFNQFPLPLATISLLLYLGVCIVDVYLNPQFLVVSFAFKLATVVALGNAVRAALAYEKERQHLLFAPELARDLFGSQRARF